GHKQHGRTGAPRICSKVTSNNLGISLDRPCAPLHERRMVSLRKGSASGASWSALPVFRLIPIAEVRPPLPQAYIHPPYTSSCAAFEKNIDRLLNVRAPFFGGHRRAVGALDARPIRHHAEADARHAFEIAFGFENAVVAPLLKRGLDQTRAASETERS